MSLRDRYRDLVESDYENMCKEVERLQSENALLKDEILVQKAFRDERANQGDKLREELEQEQNESLRQIELLADLGNSYERLRKTFEEAIIDYENTLLSIGNSEKTVKKISRNYFKQAGIKPTTKTTEG